MVIFFGYEVRAANGALQDRGSEVFIEFTRWGGSNRSDVRTSDEASRSWEDVPSKGIKKHDRMEENKHDMQKNSAGKTMQEGDRDAIPTGRDKRE